MVAQDASDADDVLKRLARDYDDKDAFSDEICNGLAVPPWAVVSKGVGGGWHGTTALDTRTGTLYAVWTKYGTATLWRGIARARPRTVMYLQRSERLRADGDVSSSVE